MRRKMSYQLYNKTTGEWPGQEWAIDRHNAKSQWLRGNKSYYRRQGKEIPLLSVKMTRKS